MSIGTPKLARGPGQGYGSHYNHSDIIFNLELLLSRQNTAEQVRRADASAISSLYDICTNVVKRLVLLENAHHISAPAVELAKFIYANLIIGDFGDVETSQLDDHQITIVMDDGSEYRIDAFRVK